MPRRGRIVDDESPQALQTGQAYAITFQRLIPSPPEPECCDEKCRLWATMLYICVVVTLASFASGATIMFWIYGKSEVELHVHHHHHVVVDGEKDSDTDTDTDTYTDTDTDAGSGMVAHGGSEVEIWMQMIWILSGQIAMLFIGFISCVGAVFCGLKCKWKADETSKGLIGLSQNEYVQQVHESKT